MRLYPGNRAEPVEHHPADGRRYQLAEMQALVGGYIQMVPLEGGGQLICNEDGISEGLAPNWRAMRDHGRDVFGGTLFGPILIASGAELGDEEEE